MFRPGQDSSSLPGSLQPPAQISLSQSVVNIQPDYGAVVPGTESGLLIGQEITCSYWLIYHAIKTQVNAGKVPRYSLQRKNLLSTAKSKKSLHLEPCLYGTR